MAHLLMAEGLTSNARNMSRQSPQHHNISGHLWRPDTIALNHRCIDQYSITCRVKQAASTASHTESVQQSIVHARLHASPVLLHRNCASYSHVRCATRERARYAPKQTSSPPKYSTTTANRRQSSVMIADLCTPRRWTGRETLSINSNAVKQVSCTMRRTLQKKVRAPVTNGLLL